MVPVDLYVVFIVANLRNHAAETHLSTQQHNTLLLRKQAHCKVHLAKVTGPPPPPPSTNRPVVSAEIPISLLMQKKPKCQDNKNTCMHSGVPLSIRFAVGHFLERSDKLRPRSVTQVRLKLGLEIGRVSRFK